MKYTKEIIEAFTRSKVSIKFQNLFQKWILSNRDNKEQDKVLFELWNQTSNINNSTLEDLKEVNDRIDRMENRRRSKLTAILKVASVVLIPILISSVFFYILKISSVNDQVLNQYYVERGEVGYITLPDSTKVWVNAESTLIYPTKFSGKERVVFLIGEANFHVDKSDKYPFIVQTSKMNVKVLGTKFNVRAYPNSSELTTTLEEGKVLLNIGDNDENSFLMNPCEAISFDVNTKKITKKTVNPADAFAWSKGDIVFSRASLTDIFQELERKFDVKITYRVKSSNQNPRLTIRFVEGDSVDDISKVLQSMVPELEVEINKIEYVNN